MKRLILNAPKLNWKHKVLLIFSSDQICMLQEKLNVGTHRMRSPTSNENGIENAEETKDQPFIEGSTSSKGISCIMGICSFITPSSCVLRCILFHLHFVQW